MLPKHFNARKFLFLTLSFFLIFQFHGDTQISTNTLEEIDAVEGKIKLTLEYVWGDDEDEDINKFFRNPSDINIDALGRIYIVDWGMSNIKVFDKSRKFIRTIGEVGKGPGNFLSPRGVVFTKKNDIVVLDTYNLRVQILNPDGKYIHSFHTGKTFIHDFSITPDDELLLYMPKGKDEKKWAVSVYDFKGNWKRDICRLPCHEMEHAVKTTLGIRKRVWCDEEPISFLADHRGDIFISYLNAPVFQKLTGNGQFLMTAAYEVPFKSFKVTLAPGSNIPQLSTGEDSKKCSVSTGIAVDWQGCVFLATTTRLPQKEDRIIIAGLPGNIRRVTKDYPEKDDMYRLLVFNPSGKIMASKKIDVSCDRLYIHKDRLFIVDMMKAIKIYEYKFELPIYAGR